MDIILIRKDKYMRVLIYPFNEDFEPFIKYGMFMGNMEITESLSPSGWGLQDK